MRVGADEEREHHPVGGENPEQPAPQERPRRLGAGAEGEPDSAQDDKKVDAHIAVQEILPDKGAPRVVKQDEQDCGAFEFVDGIDAAASDLRYLEFEGWHQAGVWGTAVSIGRPELSTIRKCSLLPAGPGISS
jgi:hypothetical protein